MHRSDQTQVKQPCQPLAIVARYNIYLRSLVQLELLPSACVIAGIFVTPGNFEDGCHVALMG